MISLTKDEILDYIYEEIGACSLENVSGGKIDAKNKILSTALGALTVVSATGATPSVGAKGFDSAKSAVVSAGKKIKGKWNGLSKKQKIALVAGTTASVAGVAIVGTIYHKHHKDEQDSKSTDIPLLIEPSEPETPNTPDKPKLRREVSEAPSPKYKKLIDDIKSQDEIEDQDAMQAATKDYDTKLDNLIKNVENIRRDYRQQFDLNASVDYIFGSKEIGMRNIKKLEELEAKVNEVLSYQNSWSPWAKKPVTLNSSEYILEKNNLPIAKQGNSLNLKEKSKDTSVMLSEKGRNEIVKRITDEHMKKRK